MKASAFQIVLSFIAISLIGYILLPHLNVRYNASPPNKMLQIKYFATTDYSAEFLERKVTTEIESAVIGLSGVQKVTSETDEQGANIELVIDNFANLDFIRFEIVAKIRQLYGNLPKGISFPKVSLINPQKTIHEEPLLTAAISSEKSQQDLQLYTDEDLLPRLNSIIGVERIEVTGRQEPAIRMHLDYKRLQQLNLSTDDVFEFITSSFNSENIGLYKSPEGNLVDVIWKNDNVHWEKETLINKLELIPISTKNGFVRLGDFTSFFDDKIKKTNHFRINGKNSLYLVVYALKTSNYIRTSERLLNRFSELNQILPKDLELEVVTDNSLFLKKELNQIYQRSIWSIGILIIALILSYRSISAVVVILGSLFTNMGLAFLCYYLFKIELNLYALAGVTVSIGLLIDNTMIMFHQLKTYSNKNILGAVLAATLTTMSALLVIFFLPDELRNDLKNFSLVFIINLSVSILICQFFVPALNDLRFRRKKNSESISVRNYKPILKLYRNYILWGRKRRTLILMLTILVFGTPVFLLPSEWEGHKWYNKTLGSDWYNYEARPWVNRILGGSLRLFNFHVFEKAGFRSPEETKLFIACRLQDGSTIDQTNDLISQMEYFLLTHFKGIKSFTTHIHGQSHGSIIVKFKDEVDFGFPERLKENAVSHALNLSGAEWNVYGVGNGYSNTNRNQTPKLNIEIRGFDRLRVNDISFQIKNILEQHPRVKDVKTRALRNPDKRYESKYILEADMNQLGRAGLSVYDLNELLSTYNTRDQKIDLGLGYRSILFSPGEQLQKDLWFMDNESVLYGSQQYRLGDQVKLVIEQESPSIQKENQEYIQSMEYTYTGPLSFGKRHQEKVLDAIQRELSLGYSVKSGEGFSFFSKNQRKRNYYLFGMIIVGVYLICSMFFESLSYPFYILIIIPLSFIGIFLFFYWTKISFDQGGYASFILVSGLTANSVIYLLNDFIQNLKHGYDRITAYMIAFEKKFLPIFLTILSTIIGFIPFVVIGINDVFWPGLAIGVIGGLSFSFLLFIFFLPILIRKLT